MTDEPTWRWWTGKRTLVSEGLTAQTRLLFLFPVSPSRSMSLLFPFSSKRNEKGKEDSMPWIKKGKAVRQVQNTRRFLSWPVFWNLSTAGKKPKSAPGDKKEVVCARLFPMAGQTTLFLTLRSTFGIACLS